MARSTPPKGKKGSKAKRSVDRAIANADRRMAALKERHAKERAASAARRGKR